MLKLFQCPQCKTNMRFSADIGLPVKCPKCAFRGCAADFVEVPVRKVYCPACNASLQVMQAMIDGNQSITCPVCKKVAPAGNYLSPPKSENKTRLRNTPGEKFSKPCLLKWQSGECRTKTIELKKGVNLIGRCSSTSTADIQLDADDTYMGRNHAIIEVVVKPGSGIEHRLSDNRSVNGTYHNGIRLEKGDIMILAPGDTVRMGRTLFKVVRE